jgi:gliding motility-associated-like protein
MCHLMFVSILARFHYIFICLAFLFIFQNVSGQQLVNTTGNTIADNTLSIEYSVGEIAITTLSSNDSYITQGLLQPILHIGIEPCKMPDLIPTGFTPNSDGLNDCYGVNQWPFTTSFEMSIFNRWGELIFRATDQYACWDGKYKGKDQPIGVYVYMIRANTDCGPTFKKGTFVLIK